MRGPMSRASLVPSVAILSAVAILCAATGSRVRGADGPSAEVDRLAAPLVQSGALVSVVVATLDHGESHVFGYGRARASDAGPPDGRTIYEIGSVSKVFTSLILARMVEDKLVALEEPVRKLLPA